MRKNSKINTFSSVHERGLLNFSRDISAKIYYAFMKARKSKSKNLDNLSLWFFHFVENQNIND